MRKRPLPYTTLNDCNRLFTNENNHPSFNKDYWNDTTTNISAPFLDKDEISKIVNEKVRELGSDFAFLNTDHLKKLTNILIDAIYESQDIKNSI